MSIAAVIRDLITAGTDPELVGRVAAALASREPVIVPDAAADRRRAADRERKREKSIPQNSADSAESPPSPDKEKSTKKEINPTPAHTYTREAAASPLAVYRQAIMGVYALASMPSPAVHLADKWFAAGWPADVVCEVIRAKLASTSGRNFPLTYFENAIADAVAARNAPVPTGGGPPARAGPNNRPPSMAARILQRDREMRANANTSDWIDETPNATIIDYPAAFGGPR